ncbi:MAG: DUF3089 domain-containing protein [Brevundimonas sp.]|uniref:DUF3089 domain-containing protein n=1 Tax=Brevundimonas sp. TaxID=1871086 RepID=UPI002633A8E6|nr:DUF3089 domain-containing protein [Brevundimonas sp.]MDI6625279.1 DUF3089 domain-containing protein [Brevundimonas sp.]MDQ7811317.1 DUF3089 domain-containing protein [Brevundimonas sp.]
MIKSGLTVRQWLGWTGFALVFLLTAAVAVWRGDILRAGLDPQVPFQTYQPPPAPNYSRADAWAMSEARAPDAGPAAVLFVHSTTYDGGREWNGPVGDPKADAYLRQVVLPNYAGPFARLGAVSAPRYRQGSLYTRLTLRDDAREARAFAWRDVAAAFETWIARHPEGPIVLAGVEQGGELVERLLRERVAVDPALRQRLVAAYLMDVVTPVDGLSPSIPACERRDQTGCVVGYSPVSEGNDGAARRRLRRALVWDGRGRLVELGRREALCVNPVTGSTSTAPAAARLNRGATNATGLEWGAHPALLAREVATQCRDGLLRYSEPDRESFRQAGSWADRRKSRPYNLFYGDLEADAAARLAAWAAQRGS